MSEAKKLQNAGINENLLESINYFLELEHLNELKKSSITNIAVGVDFEPGEKILKEGDVNDSLYFLMDGAVGVFSGGEKIATLNRRGDMLGEMSLITKKPCAATIIASDPVRVLKIETKKVDLLSEDLKKEFKNSLFRLFSVILAEKLAVTNEKAREFEITNRALKKAQDSLQSVSFKKIEEITAYQEKVFDKIGSLVKKNLAQVKNHLRDLSVAIDAKSKGILNPLIQEIEHISVELKSLSNIQSPEKVISTKTVLLAETSPQEQMNSKLALGGTGVKLDIVGSLEEGKKRLLTGKFDIICVNDETVDLIKSAKIKNPNADFVFMTSEPIQQHYQALINYPEIGAIVARHPQDRTFTVKNTMTTIGKLSSRDIFGLEKYLNWGIEIQERTVTDSDQRQETIEEMQAYFKSLGIRGSLLRKCGLVAEEILMNAIYDAPHDSEGKPMFNHLERTVPVQLNIDQAAKFRYATDGALLAISVEDPFGELTRKVILDYFANRFEQKDVPQHVKKGGGGHGLFQIISSSSLVVFNSRPRVRTEVIALFNVNVQVEKISLHPSFHFFQIE